VDKDFFEDCRVGDKALSPGRTITETDIVLFAAFTGDWLPIHTDAEYAKQTPFGERIAHGLLVLTVGSALLLRLGQYAFLPKATIALYEVDRVRFVAPAKIGDTIHTQSEVVRMTELDRTRGLIAVKGEIKNQRDEVLATFTLKGLVGRRPGPIVTSPPAETTA
jgi:3-hydroxybutyryl-CoA dehydratase